MNIHFIQCELTMRKEKDVVRWRMMINDVSKETKGKDKNLLSSSIINFNWIRSRIFLSPICFYSIWIVFTDYLILSTPTVSLQRRFFFFFFFFSSIRFDSIRISIWSDLIIVFFTSISIRLRSNTFASLFSLLSSLPVWHQIEIFFRRFFFSFILVDKCFIGKIK